MKKLLVCGALLVTMSACTSAFAEELFVDYNYNANNSITNPTEDYKTVLITKDGEQVTSDSIVYVDQAENGFASLADFLLKENPAPGYYTATFGSDDMTKPTTRYTFVIGKDDAIIQAADKMTAIKEDDESYIYTEGSETTYKKAFQLVTGADRYVGYNSVKLVLNSDYSVMGALPKDAVFDNNTTTTGEGDVGIVLQFHGMTQDEYNNADTWDVYFSTDVVDKIEGVE